MLDGNQALAYVFGTLFVGTLQEGLKYIESSFGPSGLAVITGSTAVPAGPTGVNTDNPMYSASTPNGST